MDRRYALNFYNRFDHPRDHLGGANTGENLVISVAAALVLGLVNLLLRPIILLLSLPLGFFVVFGIGFLVNAITLLLTAYILPEFQVSGFLPAFIGGVILAAINTIITGVITIDDDDFFYQGLVERLATRQKFSTSDSPGQGLVMLEIDGLSFHHITKALQDGYMPTLKEMMDEEGYQLSRVDCGLPSQTSACQSGIMFGDNYDIPSFRWFDKEQNKLYVSSKDAAEINNRYANGTGLMRGGSSINNMMDGDAEKSLLTLANIRTGTDDEKKRRARDISLLMLNPYFFTRTLALLFGDAIREVFEYWRDVRRDVQPRLNRLHKGYPFMRAATTVFMRDISAYLATLDIIRGSPSIYLTWPGYDEVRPSLRTLVGACLQDPAQLRSGGISPPRYHPAQGRPPVRAGDLIGPRAILRCHFLTALWSRLEDVHRRAHARRHPGDAQYRRG